MGEMEDGVWQHWLISWVLVATLGWLLVKAIELTVIKGGYYRSLAYDNRITENRIPAARGEIVDRKGRVVAKSVYRYYKSNGDSKIYQDEGGYQGVKFEGKELAYDLKRQYLYGESLGVVTGYVGSVSEGELKAGICGGVVDHQDVVGRGGVEESQDCSLRGTDGKRLIETDAKGAYVRELGREEPVVGKNLELTIDAYWQDRIYKLLAGRKAAVIMSEPATGKILALVSSPAFDPNVFGYSKDNSAISQLLNDGTNLPLLNRAVAARYHPGSVFKITLATGGLESGVITESTTYDDTGVIKVGDYSYSNWLWSRGGGTDGMVSIVKAITRSNDIYFYRLGEHMGVDRIAEWARKFGYGRKTGVELPGELDGLVPDEKWKLATRGEKWFLGNTYHMSIGQGDVGVTPLQVNQMTNVVASGGKLCQMSLLKDKVVSCRDLGIGANTLRIVKDGMKAVCKPGGTAYPLFNFKTSLACKTGTAEVGDGSKDTHAWLTAFAPADNPEVSITVLVERGGEGSDAAAPIVGDILKEWFDEPNTLVPRHKDQPGPLTD